ncbi:MAG: 2Fe-2S iron-sulfur cluster-binding protein [Oscillospiraceae bacterium]|nr:2Fe-2S iron-sulfur cluster-binding protein [Oscillospiraceae bacterium]
METGGSFLCSKDEIVLSAMIRSRVGPIRHGCFGGGCGICRMRVVEGDYERVKRMSRAHVTAADEEKGVVLLCCITPRSDMVVSGENT